MAELYGMVVDIKLNRINSRGDLGWRLEWQPCKTCPKLRDGQRRAQKTITQVWSTMWSSMDMHTDHLLFINVSVPCSIHPINHNSRHQAQYFMLKAQWCTWRSTPKSAPNRYRRHWSMPTKFRYCRQIIDSRDLNINVSFDRSFWYLILQTTVQFESELSCSSSPCLDASCVFLNMPKCISQCYIHIRTYDIRIKGNNARTRWSFTWRDCCCMWLWCWENVTDMARLVSLLDSYRHLFKVWDWHCNDNHIYVKKRKSMKKENQHGKDQDGKLECWCLSLPISSEVQYKSRLYLCQFFRHYKLPAWFSTLLLLHYCWKNHSQDIQRLEQSWHVLELLLLHSLER